MSLVNCWGTGRERSGASEGRAGELTFGQNKTMEAEMGRSFLVVILSWGKGAWENMWTCGVLGRICGPVGCLGEYVDL